MLISFARRQYLDEVEDLLRNVRRSLPVGAGAAPVLAVGADHLAPELRSGSAAYVTLVEAMNRRGLL